MSEASWSLIQNLREFNRKERFFVIGMALGNREFTLDSEFRKQLGEKFDVNAPHDAFAAMDYHLDWIYASLMLSHGADASNIHPRDNEITATQQDIDFLVAFADGRACYVVMLEAKGDFAFSNSQLKSKAVRFEQMFCGDGKRWGGVVPHFAIMSPYRPKRLKYKEWPDWMHPKGEVEWIELRMPGRHKKVTRCDEDKKPNIRGTHWTVEWTKTRGFQRG